MAVVVAIAIPVYRNWPALRMRYLWLYWAHEVAVHQMPATSVDTIIRDPNRAKIALTTNPGYIPGGEGNGFTVLYSPLPYRWFWHFDSRLYLARGGNSIVPFMGRLHRPDGTSRLVLVMGNSGHSGYAVDILGAVSILVLPIPKLFDPLPPPASPRASRSPTYSGPPAVRTDLKTGVPDPKDPTHIIFEFTAEADKFPPSTQPGGGGVIDAYLQNDDSVTFKLRSIWGSVPNAVLGTKMNMAGDVQSLLRRSSAGNPRLPP